MAANPLFSRKMLSVLAALLLLAAMGFFFKTRTDYYGRLEIYTELHIFERYLSLLEESKSNSFMAINLSDDLWKKASVDYANEVTSIGYIPGNGVVVRNKDPKFYIVFEPHSSTSAVNWTCKINGNVNLFFHYHGCDHWKKTVPLRQPPA